MSEHEPDPDFDEERDRVRDLLAPREAPPPDLLARVQRRIRDRSRGRFYRDRWSRETGSGATYVALVAVVLVALGVVWVLLAPIGGGAAP